MLDFTLTLTKAVVIQITGVLGIFFVFGYVLAKLQEWTQKNYYLSVGWKGILWTAWFGTPIHELGHVFFAKLFRHKITSISLFEPNKETGGLGHVSHQSSKYSLYQKIGNFFIGAAPMIFGSIVLVIMLYFLVPNGKEAFLPLTREQSTPLGFLISMKTTLTTLFAWVNIQAWNFWIFLYLSFCLASHIAPSKADRKGMWKGLVWLVFLLILVNILTLSLKVDITGYVLKINVYLGILTAVFIYTTIISALHFILSHLLLLKRKNTS